MLLQTGKRLGMLLYHTLQSRRRIALINLSLAYPQKTEPERRQIAKQTFAHIGMAAVETAWLWFRWPDPMGEVKFEGVEHLEAAIEADKGVILLQAHFTVLELCGPIIGERWPVSAVYDPPKNPLFAAYLLHQRSRHLAGLIDNRGIRQMVRKLKQGEIVWFSPDQYVAASHGGINARYFDQPSLTTSGTARIVALTGAAVIPLVPTRHDDGRRYTFTFHPPLCLDAANALKVTQQVNDQMEIDIRSQPEQYLWVHKRFKPPEADMPNPYG